jgi:hypothetical protein
LWWLVEAAAVEAFPVEVMHPPPQQEEQDKVPVETQGEQEVKGEVITVEIIQDEVAEAFLAMAWFLVETVQ